MPCKKKYETVRLDGKTALVTGANTGIGRETAKDFFIRGARVLMLCRNIQKASEAADSIKKECEGKEGLGELVVEQLDLSSLASVKECADKLKTSEERINILVNNAGLLCPLSRTEDGFEIQFATNHLGHFCLTLLLLPKIIKSVPARIVNVSSDLHAYGRVDFDDLNWETRKYNATSAYNQTKLANILFTKELAKRLKDAGIQGVTVYALHPGVIKSEFSRNFNESISTATNLLFKTVVRPFLKTPVQGAQTTIYCAVDEDAGKETGLYYKDCKAAEPARRAQNMEDARKLWDISLKMVGLETYNPFLV